MNLDYFIGFLLITGIFGCGVLVGGWLTND